MPTTIAPPSNVEAERALLGALLIDPAAFYVVGPLVDAADFFERRNGWIYEAIAHAARDGGVDHVKVCDELERVDRLAQVGGAAYLSQLVNLVPSALRAEQYAGIVRDYAQRRKLLAVLSSGGKAVYDLESPFAEVLASFESAVMGVRRDGTEHRFGAGRLADGLMQRAQYYKENPVARAECRGVAMGMQPLDAALSGLKSGVYVVAGRPSIGKTAVMLQMMAGILDAGGRCVLFSIEMSAAQVVDRLATGIARVSLQDYEQGTISDEEYTNVIMAAGRVGDWPLTIIDQSTLRPLDVLAGVRRVMIESGDVAAVFVDGLWLMTPTRERENRVQTLGSISREVKIVQRDLDIPLVLAHQLSRSCEQRGDKRPLLSDLRDSGNVEQDADVVLMLYREGYYDQSHEDANVMEIWVRKNRLGGAANECVQMFWHARCMRCLPLHRPLNIG